MSHSTGDRVDPVLRLRSSRLPSTILPCPCLQSQERVRIELDQMPVRGPRALVFLLSSKLVVLGQSTYFDSQSQEPDSVPIHPQSPVSLVMAAPLCVLAHGHWNPHHSSQAGAEQALPRCFFLEPLS